MSHYEERLSADKNAIRDRIVAVGETVDQAVQSAVQGLVKLDYDRCASVILGDLPVNRELRSVDAACHAFVARHLPSAGHLRFVSSAMRMNVALERIGDYAVTVARLTVQLKTAPPTDIAEDLVSLSDQARAMLRRAMSAFGESDRDLALETKPVAGKIQRSYDQVLRALLKDSASLSVDDLHGLMSIFSKLERVSDQAKNICELTLFELTGETKPPKRYRILFVDARNTLLGPLASALAHKAFPESGKYDSAGWNAGDTFAPELVSLAEKLTLDIKQKKPVALNTDVGALGEYHAIVGLSPDSRRHIPEVPFHTALLQWELPKLSDLDEGTTEAQRLTEISKQLSHEIRELMVTMRGEEAS